MPTLESPAYEAFAQARAKGALLIDAYDSAVFVRHRGHPRCLALKDEVVEWIADLRVLKTNMEDLNPMGLLAILDASRPSRPTTGRRLARSMSRWTSR